MAAGKVGFNFIESNIYLLENDSNNDIESKSAKELLNASGAFDTFGNIKSKNSPGVVVWSLIFITLKVFFMTYSWQNVFRKLQ